MRALPCAGRLSTTVLALLLSGLRDTADRSRIGHVAPSPGSVDDVSAGLADLVRHAVGNA